MKKIIIRNKDLYGCNVKTSIKAKSEKNEVLLIYSKIAKII